MENFWERCPVFPYLTLYALGPLLGVTWTSWRGPSGQVFPCCFSVTVLFFQFRSCSVVYLQYDIYFNSNPKISMLHIFLYSTVNLNLMIGMKQYAIKTIIQILFSDPSSILL